MNDPKEFLTAVSAIIGAAAVGFAGAYRWIKGQIEAELKVTRTDLEREISVLHSRVDALEKNSDGARAKLLQAYGEALKAEQLAIAELLIAADAALRGEHE